MNSMLTGHQELKKLIPWYVNGTLAENEMERLTHHLKTCPECKMSMAKEMAFARHYSAEARRQNPAASAMETNLHNLYQTLDQRQTGPALITKRKGALTVGAASILLMSIFLLGRIYPLNNNEYRTLTSASPAEDRVVYQLVFSKDESLETIRQAIDGSGMELISGPSSQGVYRVALWPHQKPAAAIDRLASRAEIVMAEQELR